MTFHLKCSLAGAFILLSPGLLLASEDASAKHFDEDALFELDLSELMRIPVSSVAKAERPLFDSAAAVTVLTREEVRRSGLRQLPEVLRLIPGVNVSRANAGTWSVSTRGFPAPNDNNILVLVDGRSIYSQGNAKVYWASQPLFVEDIDRIEVIRGPAGTQWGYNAVNGVINIITRPANETPGTFIEAGAGLYDEGFLQARQGFQVSDNTHARVFFDGWTHGPLEDSAGNNTEDESERTAVGIRVDHFFKNDAHLRIGADFFDAAQGFPTNFIATPVASEDMQRGGSLEGSYTRELTGDWQMAINSYWHYEDLTFGQFGQAVEEEAFSVSSHTIDLDGLFTFNGGDRHKLTMGGGIRYIAFNLDEGYLGLDFQPDEEDWILLNLFIEDEITLVPDRLRLTAGAKLLYNNQTDAGVLPNLRLLYTPSDRQRWWAAAAQSLKTPTLVNGVGGLVDVGIPGLNPFFTGEPLEDETVHTLQAGVRQLLHEKLFFDATVFYSRYHDIQSIQVNPVTGIASNNGDGSAESWGAEFAVEWNALENWRLRGSYSALHVDYQPPFVAAPTNSFFSQYEDASPEHQFQLHSFLQLRDDLQLDAHLYWTGATEERIVRFVSPEPLQVKVDDRLRLDLRLAWTPTPDLTLAIVGQNLLENTQQETATPRFAFSQPRLAEIPRTVYGSVTLRF